MKKLNSTYVFTYVLVEFLGALGRSQKQKGAKKWAKMLPNELKSPQSKIHVAVVKNINNVVVNNLQSHEI